MSQLYVITGQTATGKTRAALELAKRIDGELVNCDSRQIYQKLTIVTGKDLPEDAHFSLNKELTTAVNPEYSIGYYVIEGIPLWLYDIVPPKKAFSAYEYQRCALAVIQDILKRGKTPILVGGSVFYLRYLLYTKTTSEDEDTTKQELREELEQLSVEELQARLKKLNESVYLSMNESDNRNPRRLQRKIEILKIDPEFEFDETFTTNYLSSKTSMLHTSNSIDIVIESYLWSTQEEAKKAIQKRVEDRIKNGAVEEVTTLLSQGYTLNEYGLQSIGYPQIGQYLKKEIDLACLIEIWTTKELQYAKRQRTFSSKIPGIRIINPLAKDD